MRPVSGVLPGSFTTTDAATPKSAAENHSPAVLGLIAEARNTVSNLRRLADKLVDAGYPNAAAGVEVGADDLEAAVAKAAVPSSGTHP